MPHSFQFVSNKNMRIPFYSVLFLSFFFCLHSFAANMTTNEIENLSFQQRNITPPENQNRDETQFNKCVQMSLRKITATSRDLSLMDCLKNHRQISQNKCLQVSNRFEYQTNADQARSFCLFSRTKQISAETCLREADLFLFEDNEDSARWQCLLGETKNLNYQNCQKIARGMNAIPSRNRALQFCETRR